MGAAPDAGLSSAAGERMAMQKESESMKAYRLGLAAYQSGDFESASVSFRWAAGIDPENPVYCLAAARSAACAGANGEAERLFLLAMSATRRAMGEGHPFILLAARDLAALYGRTGRREDMKALARQVIGAAYPRAVARAGQRAVAALKDLWEMADEEVDNPEILGILGKP